MIAMLPRPYEGTLTVLSGHAAVIQADIATAQPKYYGLQGITVEASAVVLSGDFLCSPAAENVFRKIVIGDDRFAKCNHYDIFRALEAAGAVGFIHLVDRSTPIGWATFEHFSWSANAMISKNITVVEAYAEDLGFASTTLNLRARITPPHDETFADVYLSWHWTLVLRVMVPIMALRVTVSGTMGICNSWYLYCREEDPVNVQIKFASFFVCTIATSTAFLLGLICALGQWGPEVCPNYYHQFFVTGFYGTLMLTTSVSCCIMRERLRSFWQYPPRLLWPHNRFRLILIFVIGVGGDIFLGIFRMIGIENSAIFTSASFVTSGLISGITCIVLLAYAWALGKPILSMMNLRARAPQDQTLVMQQLFFVVVALTMNGTFSLLNLLSTVAFAYLQISASYRPLNYSLAMYWLVLARLGLMHWQVTTHILCQFTQLTFWYRRIYNNTF